MDDWDKVLKIIEDYRKEKPLSVARNEACDMAKKVIENLRLTEVR